MGARYLGVLYILETKFEVISNLKVKNRVGEMVKIKVFNKKCCTCRCLKLEGALISTLTPIILQMRLYRAWQIRFNSILILAY